MNRTDRSVWSDTLGARVAASEESASRGKRGASSAIVLWACPWPLALIADVRATAMTAATTNLDARAPGVNAVAIGGATASTAFSTAEPGQGALLWQPTTTL